MKNRPSGYEWTVRGKEVVISHHGAIATVLRGEKARQFAKAVERSDPQLLMARLAVNDKRGDARIAKEDAKKR